MFYILAVEFKSIKIFMVLTMKVRKILQRKYGGYDEIDNNLFYGIKIIFSL